MDFIDDHILISQQLVTDLQRVLTPSELSKISQALYSLPKSGEGQTYTISQYVAAKIWEREQAGTL